MIYLDNAATTRKKPQPVVDAVTAALCSLGNSARGAHAGALAAARVIYDARCRAAAFFGCTSPDRVIFTANATEALNIALFGLFQRGDHVISTDLEHNSVLRPLYRLEAEHGVSLSFVPADRRGCIDYADFDRLIRPETRAIVCTHASNLTGNLLDLARIGQIAKAHDLYLIVDAAQTAGCFPIDMEALGIDVLCFTGHKGLMGPQGTGGLCLRAGVELRPWKVGGSGVQSYLPTQPAEYPTRLEAGTLNGHGLAGLSAAFAYLQSVGLPAVQEHEAALTRRFYEGVKDIDGVTVYGDFFAPERAAIVSLNLRGEDSGSVADALAEYYDIAVRPGAHCAPRMHRALGTEQTGAVRFSFSWYNTEAEIDAAIQAVKELAAE